MESEVAKKLAEASKALRGIEIVIHTDADMTPPGKRRWAVVTHRHNGRKCGKQLRWYVGRKAYRTLPYSADNVALSERWEKAQA